MTAPLGPYRTPATPTTRHRHDWRWTFHYDTPSDMRLVWFCAECRIIAGPLHAMWLSLKHRV